MIFTILIFVLPLATALAFGVIAERMGAKSLSGLFAMIGLGVGTYFIYAASSFVTYQ